MSYKKYFLFKDLDLNQRIKEKEFDDPKHEQNFIDEMFHEHGCKLIEEYTEEQFEQLGKVDKVVNFGNRYGTIGKSPTRSISLNEGSRDLPTNR